MQSKIILEKINVTIFSFVCLVFKIENPLNKKEKVLKFFEIIENSFKIETLKLNIDKASNSTDIPTKLNQIKLRSY